MNESLARFLLGIGVPAAALAAVLVPYLAVRSELPDRLASHFDSSGTPDGSMTHGGFLAVTLIMVAVGAAACIWLARSHGRMPSSLAPLVGFLGGFAIGMGAAIAAVTFLSHRGLQDWQQADGGWTLTAVPLIASLAVGAVTARAGLVLPRRDPGITAEDRPVMDLDLSENAVWAETMHSVWLARLAALVVVGGAVIALTTSATAILPALLIGVLMLSLATLQVRADRQGLHVKYGALPWPRTHISIDDIEVASVIDVRPTEWGGWGYRGSLKLMKQAAVVHRAGPGIRLDLRGGKTFVVTVDHPDMPVALLNAEIARAGIPAG